MAKHVVSRSGLELIQAYEKADLVISKGQANYESLEALGKEDRRLYFLLRAKCEIVAGNLGVNLGQMVFCCSHGESKD
ncbi:MAG: ARMT1-like domain-containing protein [Paludibacter sp.]